MADEEEQRRKAEEDAALKLPPYPPPPPFYLNFTTENKDRLEHAKRDAGLDTSTDTQLSADQILSLPAELRYLIPPSPPGDTQEFKVFGTPTQLSGHDTFTGTMEWISQTMDTKWILKDWSYEQLYPSTSSSSSASSTLDRQRYLFRFLRSILVAYIELLGIAAVNPTSDLKDDKLKDILTLVTNMHALINEYRPHQARETLIREMEKQVERKKREIEGVRRMKERVGEVLEGFGREIPSEKDGNNEEESVVAQEAERRKEVQKQMWVTMDEMLG
jgi:mediator of RNA polymerase II transcription subunit 7